MTTQRAWFAGAAIMLAALAVSGCGSGTAAARPAGSAPGSAPAGPVVPTDRLLPLDADARRWVDSTLAALGPRERAAQLIMPWMSGKFTPVESDEWRTLRSWVDAGLGGIVVSIGPPVAMADKLNRLQRLSGVPLLIAADMERGPGQRLDGGVVLPYGMDMGGGTEFPPVMAIGATGDPQLAYEMGRVTAREGRAVGIHLNFAPVVDVNNNPANPIINVRSYGADARTVARFVDAHVRGLTDHGLMSTAKHFPGHGDTSGDTHLELQILRIDGARADSVELVPFRAAIGAGVDAVMSAHVAFPALTGDPERPATLSARMLDSLLVGELDFRGLVVTDALDMGAIVRGYGPVEAAVLALEAGADILLMPREPLRLIDGVVEAVESGRISEARLARSVRKILEAKARVGLHRQREVDVGRVAEVVNSDAHRALADEISARSITLVRDREGLVPLAADAGARVLSITYSDDLSPFAADALHDRLTQSLPALERVVLEGPVPDGVLDSIGRRAEAADLVLFVADVTVRSGKGGVAVDPAVAERVREIAARRPVVVVSMGNPYLLQQVPEVGTYVLAWGGSETSQHAAARALLGEAPIQGRLPIPIPPLHEPGDGLRRDSVATAAAGSAGPDPHDAVGGWGADPRLDPAALAALDEAVAAAIRDGVTPGAVVAVGRGNGGVRVKAYGHVDRAAGAPPMTQYTVFDLASLTKVVGTTSAVMLLVDRGRVELDEPLSSYLPAWPRGGWRDAVTIRRLLTHRAGLPGFIRFWHPSEGAVRGREAYVRAIAGRGPEYEPGSEMVYSDLGFILLGAMVEAVTGDRLDVFLDRELWTPLGMDDTGFNPRPDLMAAVWREAGAGSPGDPGASEVSIALERIAPTELDTVFRGTHVHGVVHDENAFAMGGVAGHAGLFSTAPDLARFARLMLEGGVAADGRRVVGAETVRLFTGSQAEGRRALGWDRPPGSGRMAAALSDSAFGHTGFTGTSLWMDPERDLFVVLLTNRVNPTREGPSIMPLRRAVHEHAAEASK